VNVPDWYEAVLLALAAWRSFQLVAFDDILDRPRRYVTRLGSEWTQEGDKVPDDYRFRLANFITCPYCMGAWITAAWWGAWQVWPHSTLVVAALLALHAGLVGAHKLLSSE
jgi:hypothetical protein